jgi:hypothetical protein
VTLQTVWLEEKGEGHVSSFVATLTPYRISENMLGTDQNNTEMDSRLLASFCCESNVVRHLYAANYEGLWQKVPAFS